MPLTYCCSSVITAGALWTPLFAADEFDENIKKIMTQIQIAAGTTSALDESISTNEIAGEDEIHLEQSMFSLDEMREELERLRADEHPPEVSTSAGGMCALPAEADDAVKRLPKGLRITAEMETLCKALVVSDQSHICFWGAGGIGKTTVSAWLVGDDDTRKHFEQIVWVTLGQQPNLVAAQNLMHLQLTGSEFDVATTAESKKELLKQAMSGKKVLLVLDDLWDARHEKLLNFIDDTTRSKVLVSSRNRSVFAEGAEIVDIGFPTEDEAVKMLLSVAELPLDGDVPTEAIEIAKFCKHLPLALGIAGKLVHELEVTDDWEGVLDLMREEFKDTGHDRSMEELTEGIIRTSLNAIQGAHCDNILRLFNAFAIVPEDTRVPIEMIGMLFEVESDTLLSKSPATLNLRRWLKALIDRSLILGPVDRPSLHDMVRETLIKWKSDEARGMNRRLVELWRSRRPEKGGWPLQSTQKVPQYILQTAEHHINGAWETDWSKDEGAIEWLSDFTEDGKQDAIPVFAAKALGVAHTTELAKAAGEWMRASLYFSASALSEQMQYAWAESTLQQIKAAAKMLERVESHKAKNQLEISVLLMALQSYDQDLDLPGYTTRLKEIFEDDPEAGDIFARLNFLQFTEL